MLKAEVGETVSAVVWKWYVILSDERTGGLCDSHSRDRSQQTFKGRRKRQWARNDRPIIVQFCIKSHEKISRYAV